MAAPIAEGPPLYGDDDQSGIGSFSWLTDERRQKIESVYENQDIPPIVNKMCSELFASHFYFPSEQQKLRERLRERLSNLGYTSEQWAYLYQVTHSSSFAQMFRLYTHNTDEDPVELAVRYVERYTNFKISLSHVPRETGFTIIPIPKRG